MELEYWEKQLILYTKGHYKRVNYDKDLKRFPSQYYCLSLDQTEQTAVLHMVTDLYQKLVDNDHIHFTLNKFITDIFKRAWWDSSKRDVSYDNILRQMLAEIRGITVLGAGLDLGSVDEKLFNIIQEDIKDEELLTN